MASVLLQKTPYGSFGGQPGGTLSRTKKDLSPSVMDKGEELPLTAEELARQYAERDAISPPTVGPVSIDPTDWLTPGGLAKTAAILKSVIAPAAATSAAILVGSRAAGPTSPLQRSVGAGQLGAFRSANNTMLAREMLTDIKTLRDTTVREGERYYSQGYFHPRDQERITTQILSKLSDKEISKYGTPEFKLDKWLRTTNTTPNQMPPYIGEVTAEKLLHQSAQIKTINSAKAELIKAVEQGKFTSEEMPTVERALSIFDKDLLKQTEGPLIEDFLLAQKQGKKLLSTPYTSDPYYDIKTGAKELARAIVKHGISTETIEKGSLQQVVAKVNKADDDAVRVLKKSMEAKSQVIRARTQELATKQSTGAEDGFVRLETPQDLAQETDILNHCIGAVERDNDKYIPAFDTVTGKTNKGIDSNNTSFAAYKAALESGSSEFYSYRPLGLPEITLEVKNVLRPGGSYKDPNYKIKTITQAYGKEDRAPTELEVKAIREFAQKKEIAFKASRFLEGAQDYIPPNPIAPWPFPINNNPIVPVPD